jgi:putative membrane protein
MFLLISPLLESLLNVAVYTAAGLLLFALAFFVMGKATPFSLRKEIEEDQNVALAIVIGSVIIGIALIIVASIVG